VKSQLWILVSFEMVWGLQIFLLLNLFPPGCNVAFTGCGLRYGAVCKVTASSFHHHAGWRRSKDDKEDDKEGEDDNPPPPIPAHKVQLTAANVIAAQAKAGKDSVDMAAYKVRTERLSCPSPLFAHSCSLCHPALNP